MLKSTDQIFKNVSEQIVFVYSTTKIMEG